MLDLQPPPAPVAETRAAPRFAPEPEPTPVFKPSATISISTRRKSFPRARIDEDLMIVEHEVEAEFEPMPEPEPEPVFTPQARPPRRPSGARWKPKR